MTAQAPKTIRYNRSTFEVTEYLEEDVFDEITAVRKIASGVIEVLKINIWHYNVKRFVPDVRIDRLMMTKREVTKWFNLTDKEVDEDESELD